MGEPVQPVEPIPAPQPTKIDVIYQIWDDVKNKWLPNVTNDSDYPGIFGQEIDGIQIKF